MPKKAAQVINEKKITSDNAERIYKAVSNATRWAHESVFDDMVGYVENLFDFRNALNRSDEEALEGLVDKLAGFPEFLMQMNGDEPPKSVYESITESMDMRSKWVFEQDIRHLGDALGIQMDMDRMLGKNATISVEGMVYNREQFRQRMYDNNWKKGADDDLIDLIFDSYRSSVQYGLSRDTSEHREHAMNRILGELLSADSEDRIKADLLRQFAGGSGIPEMFYEPLKNYELMYDTRSKRSGHQKEKAAFLAEAQKNGWNLGGDEEFLSSAFDLRWNPDGSFNRNIDNALRVMISREVHFNTDESDIYQYNARSNSLAQFKEAILSHPEEKRTESMKKCLEDLDQKIRQADLEKKANKFAEKVVRDGYWYDGGRPSGLHLLRDMYMASDGMPEDHPYVQQLKLIESGKSNIYPQYEMRKEQNGVLCPKQTEAEFGKAMDILKESGIDTPLVRQAVNGLEKRLSDLKNTRAYKLTEEQFDQLMKWASITQEDKDKLKAFADSVKKARADLPQELRDLAEGLGRSADSVKSYSAKVNYFEYIGGLQGMKNLAENLPEFTGKLGTHHRLYESAMSVLGLMAPEKVEETKAKAKETSELYRAELEKADEALYSPMQQSLQEKFQRFDAELEQFRMMKDNFDKVRKSYFGHRNSTLYNDMVGKLDEICDPANYNRLDELKTDLTPLVTAYLDHTRLSRASKSHPNAETRRLCAFQLLEMTDTATFEDYRTRANELRGPEDQITRERLAGLPGVGKPAETGERNRTNIRNLIDEEKELHPEREHKGRVSVNRESVAKENVIENPVTEGARKK